MSALLDWIKSPSQLRKLSRDNLAPLAAELRERLIQSVSQTGGHFSSNLGTVELTVALHYVFNTPEDRLVWDVGHQTYPHKMLTGRNEQMVQHSQCPQRDQIYWGRDNSQDRLQLLHSPCLCG